MTDTATVYDQLQEILRCPITKGSLRLLQSQEVKWINERIAIGALVHIDGSPIQTCFGSGFVSCEGQFAYPVIEDIIVLLDNLAIPLAERNVASQICLRPEKKILQDFYEQIGWHKKGEDGTGLFVDALKWEDLRPVASQYIHDCHLRVNRYIKNRGQYLLDAGSGPVQYQEYLTYSQEYQHRICVDISYLALKEAKRKLGDKGIYILGDITNIPLKDNTIDGAVSLHVIYHIPKDEQVNAIREIQRVLKPGASAAVVYSWRNSLLMSWFMLPRRIKKTARNLIQKQKSFIKSTLKIKRGPLSTSPGHVPETPYHYAYDRKYFETHLIGINYRIFVWRSVTVNFTRTYIHPRLFGSLFLKGIYRLEERYPHLFGRIGQYPLFVIKH
jgi:SAM-dependent methyltransferase/uncharacterized protein YbaR (Trm112 family)